MNLRNWSTAELSSINYAAGYWITHPVNVELYITVQFSAGSSLLYTSHETLFIQLNMEISIKR